MLALALEYNQGPISSAKIADREQVSVKYLEQLLAALRNAGLVRTVRGAHGGHELNLPPEEITLRQIFEVLEGRMGLVECTTQPGLCDRHDTCVTQEVWAQMYEACLGILASTSLSDLAERNRVKRGACESSGDRGGSQMLESQSHRSGRTLPRLCDRD